MVLILTTNYNNNRKKNICLTTIVYMSIKILLLLVEAREKYKEKNICILDI